jgi:hypothetical protein
MRMIDMEPKLFLDVPCPTCGVTSGNRCVLHSGGLRTEPQVDRKRSAVEAVKGKESAASIYANVGLLEG